MEQRGVQCLSHTLTVEIVTQRVILVFILRHLYFLAHNTILNILIPI